MTSLEATLLSWISQEQAEALKKAAYLVAEETGTAPLEQRASHATRRIISLLNLKDVASGLSDGENLVQGAKTQLAGIVKEISKFPNPGDPGTASDSGPDFSFPWQWPGPIPPGPLSVILQLNLYSKQIVDDKLKSDIKDFILQIVDKSSKVV